MMNKKSNCNQNLKFSQISSINTIIKNYILYTYSSLQLFEQINIA